MKGRVEIRIAFAYEGQGWGLTTKRACEGTFLGESNDLYLEEVYTFVKSYLVVHLRPHLTDKRKLGLKGKKYAYPFNLANSTLEN